MNITSDKLLRNSGSEFESDQESIELTEEEMDM